MTVYLKFKFNKRREICSAKAEAAPHEEQLGERDGWFRRAWVKILKSSSVPERIADARGVGFSAVFVGC